jgi:integrase/recombinase XerD
VVYSPVLTYEVFSYQVALRIEEHAHVRYHPPSPLALNLSQELPADCHPARLYLARLSASSRRSMTQALHSLAGLLTDGEDTAFTLNWAALRSEHIAALRTRLAERYTVTAANKMLSVLGSVLLEAYLLGQMAADDYRCAINIMPIQGHMLPRPSVPTASEQAALLEDGAQAHPRTGARQRP